VSILHREAVPRAVFVVEDALPVLQVLEEGAHKGGTVRVVECPVASPETLQGKLYNENLPVT
jgi:hypothetical protein